MKYCASIPYQLQDSELKLQKLHTQIAEDKTREYEEKLHSLSGELEDVRTRLQAAEKQADEPPPLLLQLQSEMAKMKVRSCDGSCDIIVGSHDHHFHHNVLTDRKMHCQISWNTKIKRFSSV